MKMKLFYAESHLESKKEACKLNQQHCYLKILQSLYETGILFFVSLVPLFNELNKSLKSSVPFFSLIVKGSIFSFLVMYMAEAPGMDKILNLVVFGLLVSKMNNTVTCKGNMYVRCEK